jgi:protein SERAC1
MYAVQPCRFSDFKANRVLLQALDRSDRVSDTLPHLARIFSSTRGIIFLGTPHRGSDISSLAKVVASIAKVAFQTVNEDLIRDLERDSQILDRIRDSFSRILNRRTFTVWSFVEELATIGVGKVYHLHMSAT